MSHFYDPKTGEARHFVEKKDGSGNRPSTVADARKNGWVPSPTTVLSILAKPALVDWQIKQGVLAVATAPIVTGESLDARIERILEQERQHEEESRIARDMGEQIHEAIQYALEDKPFDRALAAYVEPVLKFVLGEGAVLKTETTLIGDGFAGRCDCITKGNAVGVWDFKSCTTIPAKPYPEALLQVSSYAGALGNTGNDPIEAWVVYISKKEAGAVTAFRSANWPLDFERFKLLLKFFQLTNRLL